MEMQHIVIFVLLGAVCMFIVTGGFLSMTSDDEPSKVSLASGAAVGGAMGAALSYVTSLPNMISGGGPDMKVGLPTF